MSVFSSLRYCLGDPSDHSSIWAALIFLPFGFFFDAFDGKVARWRKKSSLMGQELDSLADLVCSAKRASQQNPHPQDTADDDIDFLWRCAGYGRLHHWSPLHGRYTRFVIL